MTYILVIALGGMLIFYFSSANRFSRSDRKEYEKQLKNLQMQIDLQTKQKQALLDTITMRDKKIERTLRFIDSVLKNGEKNVDVRYIDRYKVTRSLTGDSLSARLRKLFAK